MLCDEDTNSVLHNGVLVWQRMEQRVLMDCSASLRRTLYAARRRRSTLLRLCRGLRAWTVVSRLPASIAPRLVPPSVLNWQHRKTKSELTRAATAQGQILLSLFECDARARSGRKTLGSLSDKLADWQIQAGRGAQTPRLGISPCLFTQGI